MAGDQFDAIVVGAGVAGCTAAYLLARAGLQVVLIERGPYPGSKNLSGGVLYGRVLHDILPEFWNEAPVERRIDRFIISFVSGEAAFNVDFKTQAFDQPPFNAFTVLRARFDRWLAAKAEAAGAMLVTGVRVDRVVRQDGRVAGVAAGDEELRADVVIAADGANSFLAQEAGLRGRLPHDGIALGVKELIGLPRETIEERFHLEGDEGAAYTIVGTASKGLAGGGFLYTNRESLSVGLVMILDGLLRNQARPADMMEEFLSSPLIAPLVKGGKLLEYGAHLVPEGGVDKMARLFTDGMLVIGDAAGLGINNGFAVRGMDLAIGSAAAAAEAILEAKAAGDFSAAKLVAYKEKLERSFVMADMRTYAGAPRFFENERLYTAYPQLLAYLMERIYHQEARPKEHLLPTLMKSIRSSRISLLDLARDIWNGVRAL